MEGGECVWIKRCRRKRPLLFSSSFLLRRDRLDLTRRDRASVHRCHSVGCRASRNVWKSVHQCVELGVLRFLRTDVRGAAEDRREIRRLFEHARRV